MNRQDAIDFIKKTDAGEGLEFIPSIQHKFKVEIHVSGFHGKQRLVAIPSTFEGLPVTAINNCAFASSKNIKVVQIPNSVTCIGHSAFKNCIALENVQIPDSVNFIDPSAFELCRNLKEINIPDAVILVMADTFKDCQNLNCIAGNSILQIVTSAFANCTSLEEIKFPRLRLCDKNVFSGCSLLKRATVSKDIATVSKNILGEPLLTPFEFPASVKVTYK